MESLTGLNTEEVETVKNSARPAKIEPEIERVKLGKIESSKVAAWLKQLDEVSKGFLQLSKSELVNFLIRERRDELSAKEIALIRANHHDPIRYLNWITPRLKEALISGDADQIARIQEEIRGIELSVNSKTPGLAENGESAAISKLKRRRKKETDVPSQDSNLSDHLVSAREGPE